MDCDVWASLWTQVIEMTSVTPAADIWSVGCLAIELLTGQPPYYDLQPMSALFRIVQVRQNRPPLLNYRRSIDILYATHFLMDACRRGRLGPACCRTPCMQKACAAPACAQDEHPSLPESISGEMQDFLLACFQKDPQRRPAAAALLRHAWLRHQRATLRASWSRTAGLKARGGRTDAHVSVTSVVERILQVPALPDR